MNEEGLVPVESTSSGSAMSSSHGQEEAKECSASYQKLVTNAEDEKPNQRYSINIQRKIVPLSPDFDFSIWRCCHLFLSSYGVAIVAVSAFC